ncbi:cytochrome P450 [Rhizophagus irregularis DAOM 181602=DAOM 197198]|nr:cytochrome P450 [Rhizophagus irregularis DAOM 181602=DAOM 197198]
MISKFFENFNYLSLIVIIIIFYVTYYYYKYFNRINPLPGPFPIPFFGNLHQLFIFHGGSLKEFYNFNYKKYGDIFEVYFDTRSITLNSSEHIEKILSASTRNPYIMKLSEDDSKGYYELGVMGKGLLINQEFKSWRYNRHFFTQAILSPKFVHEATYWTCKLFEELESYWNKLYFKGDNKNVLDFSLWSNQFTNDMIFTLLTGERSYSMASYFNELSDNEKAERPSALIDETVKFVQAIRKYLMVAGTDTTANTISYIIYYLAHNPDVKKKMLNEIDRIFQGDKTRPITENNLNNLKYCEAIAKEVSRIFSVVNSLPRCLERPEEIAGYQWPANTHVRINIDAIHHNSEYWEEPEKFNPDRWLDEGFEPKKNSFIAFGKGLRICPGRKLAIIELVCLMSLLYRKYEIDLVNKDAPLKTLSFSITACTELLVEIRLRN